ncbi:MAG: efflux RND transporter permease subunit [Alistipes indistinctus]
MVIPRLKQVTGVADVSNYGGITTQYQIEIDPRKMEQYGISLADISEKVEKNNINAGGSIVSRGDLGYVIRGIGLIKGLEDLGNIVVKTVDGVPVYLNDIGKLKYGNLERKGVLGFTDEQRDYSDGVEGIVQMLRGQNPSEVLKDVHKAVDELNGDVLPEGVSIHPFMDRTDLVGTTLHTVSRTLLEGMLLVLLVLILFLGSWRGALLVALTIPLSLLVAFILMKVTDIPPTAAFVGGDRFRYFGRRCDRDDGDDPQETRKPSRSRTDQRGVIRRATQVARPIFFSTVIIITAYLPLFAFEHIEKKLFTPLAYTVGYALLGALAVALLLIPGLAFLAYCKPRKTYRNRWLEKLTNGYNNQIKRLMERPKVIFGSRWPRFSWARACCR